MPKYRTYIIEWEGPFQEPSGTNGGNGIYLLTGIQKYKRDLDIQYCGITKNEFYKRLGSAHHVNGKISRNKEYWFGKICSGNNTRYALERVEDLIVNFRQLNINDKKKKIKPSKLLPSIIINRWYDSNHIIRKRRIYQAQYLEDIIFWDGEIWHYTNHLVTSKSSPYKSE